MPVQLSLLNERVNGQTRGSKVEFFLYIVWPSTVILLRRGCSYYFYHNIFPYINLSDDNIVRDALSAT